MCAGGTPKVENAKQVHGCVRRKLTNMHAENTLKPKTEVSYA